MKINDRVDVKVTPRPNLFAQWLAFPSQKTDRRLIQNHCPAIGRSFAGRKGVPKTKGA
jgi:hypothetical protein